MKKRGIALISVLIVAAALMGVLAVGLALGDRGVLFVSQAHQRNVALGAAEAGVYEVVVRLESDKHFTGTATGTLPDTGGTYTVEVDNQLWTGGVATVVSTGTYGSVNRTLEVKLEPDTVSFGAVGVGGKIYIHDGAYTNGIASTANPIFRPGGIHSEYNGGDHALTADIFQEPGPVEMRATGHLSTRGSIDPALVTIAEQVETSVSQPQYRLDKAQLLSGSFSTGSVPSSGVLSTNIRLSGPAVFNRPIVVPEGVTLHIEDDVEFRRGIKGDGNIVVDGNIIIQTTAEFDPSIKEGVKVVADGSITVTHPRVEIDHDDGVEYNMDHVGDYFAQMPPDAPSQIANNLPVSAPSGGNFFNWFDSNAGSGNPNFQIWYNGDGSETKPGLSPATKAWLQASRPIKNDIVAWSNR